jgi:GxxExxY protein
MVTKSGSVKRKDLLYPELSYKIIGSAFDVYNKLGSGHLEKNYQRALVESFASNHLEFSEQVYCPVIYNGKVIGRKFLDFLVEGKIIVEIKKDARFSKANIDQVLDYLRANKLKLSILINFGNNGVVFKRIVNFN